MNNETKKTAVPELRFPEFQRTGEWRIERLEKFFSERQESGYPNLPLLSLTDKEGIIPQEESNRKNTSSADKGKYLRVCVGDIAYNTMRMWEGRSAFVNIEGIISPAYTVCKPESNVDGLFFSYYFKTQSLIQQFHRYSQGLVKDTLNLKFSAFSRILTALPTEIAEQQKIAECLSSLDELIAAWSAKLEALKAHKRGLMQALFPAEGETEPKLRFPEFQSAGKWVEESFESLYDFKGTNSLSREKLNYKYGSVKNIHYGDIHTKFATLFDITKEKVPFVNDSVPIDKIKEENYCIEGDIIFADASEDLNDIGKCIEVVNLNGERLLSGLHTQFARQKVRKLVLGFAGHLFMSGAIRAQIQNEAQGTKVLGISAGRLSKIKVCYPVDEIEQQKIADCLSSLDDLLAAQAQHLEALKRHKKGLMQGLFPPTGHQQT